MKHSALLTWITAFCLLTFVFQSFAFGKVNPETTITLGSDKSSKIYTLKDLSQRIKPKKNFNVKSPIYKDSQLSYEGLNFKSLVGLIKKDHKFKTKKYSIVIKCSDGYLPVLEAKILERGDSLLAYKELKGPEGWERTEDKNWTLLKVHGKIKHPGPFYLVWDTPKGYPHGWPYQIEEIYLVPTADVMDFLTKKKK